MHVLILDSDASVSSAIAWFLRSQGFEVSRANDGCDALVIARDQGVNIAAVITDLQMYRLNDKEMWQKLRPLVSPRCKIVFLSGSSDPYPQVSTGLPCEMLREPFSLKALMANLSTAR